VVVCVPPLSAGSSKRGGFRPSCSTSRSPNLHKHPLQRRLQRSFFDLNNVIRNPLNGIGNLISMHFAKARQRSQNEQIEGSRRNFVSMQSNTSDIVRLWQYRIVSNASQVSVAAACRMTELGSALPDRWSATLPQAPTQLKDSARCQCDHSRLIESVACSRGSVRSFAPKRAPKGIGSSPNRLPMRGKVRRRSFGAHCATPMLLADAFTMCQIRWCFTILPMEWQRILPGCPWLEPGCPWLSPLVTSLLSGHAFVAYLYLHEEFQVNLRILAIAL
jgi:hypothetical protein